MSIQPNTDMVLRISRSLLRPSPINPRKHFDAQKLSELGLNLRQNGVINPLVVRPCEPTEEHPHATFEIIAGECRWRSSDECPHPERPENMEPIEELPVLVRHVTDHVTLEMMLSENMQRNDLTPMEEARAFASALSQRLPDGELVYPTQAAFAEKIGVSVQVVRARVSLLKLPRIGMEALETGVLSYKTARVVCALPSSVVETVLEHVLHPQSYSVWLPGIGYPRRPLDADEATLLIREKFVRPLKGVGWKLDDENLLPVVEENGERIEGGACLGCPWNSAPQSEKLPGEKKGPGRPKGEAQQCLHPECFKRKAEIAAAAALLKATQQGARELKESEVKDQLDSNGRPTWKSRFVRLDEKPDHVQRNGSIDEKELPKWSKLVAGEAQPEVYVATLETGQVVKLVEKKAAVAAAQQNGNGHFLNASSAGVSLQEEDWKEQQRKENEKRKLQTAVSFAVLAKTIEKVAEVGTLPTGFWRWMIGVALYHGGVDAACVVNKRRSLGASAESVESVKALAKKLKDEAELRGLALELMVARQVKFGYDEPTQLLDLSELYGVDAKAIEKEVKKAAKEKAKPKGKKQSKRKQVDAEDDADPEDESLGEIELSETDGEVAEQQASEPRAEPEASYQVSETALSLILARFEDGEEISSLEIAKRMHVPALFAQRVMATLLHLGRVKKGKLVAEIEHDGNAEAAGAGQIEPEADWVTALGHFNPGDEVSIARLQRKLKIGYRKASEIFDTLVDLARVQEGKLVAVAADESR